MRVCARFLRRDRLANTSPVISVCLRKCAENYTISLFLKTAISILVISNRNSLRVLSDKISSEYFIRKTYLHFSIGNGQPEPALCQLYRHTFVPCALTRWSSYSQCTGVSEYRPLSAFKLTTAHIRIITLTWYPNTVAISDITTHHTNRRRI